MSERTDLFRRKNIGRQRQSSYKNIFINSGFKKIELEHILLEDCDNILTLAKKKFSSLKRKIEIINLDALFIDSDLIRKIYLKLSDKSKCYIYTDYFEFCGMFKVNSKTAFELAFVVAKNDSQNTCFVLDADLNYSFLINFDVESNRIDIQVWE